jgi:hypothetical protein
MKTPASSLRSLWTAVGWFGVLLLVFLSLMRNPPSLDIAYFDKIGHVSAYAVLMWWWAQLDIAFARRLTTAAALVALGVGLEFMQRATGYRTFESADMAADAIGVAAGWLLAPPRLPNLLALAERIAATRE